MACWVLRLDRKSPPFHLALAYFWDIVPYNAKKRKGQKKPSVPSPAGRQPSPAWRGWPGRSPGRVWRGPLKVKAGPR